MGINKACAIWLVALFALTGCGRVLDSFEKKSLNPGLRSYATPAGIGLPFTRVSIHSGQRQLDGFLVRAPATCPAPSAAVLLFHGRDETAPDWIKAQKYLHDHCVSSLIFDYSGHGRSSPGGTVEHLNQDAVAATRFFMSAFVGTQRRCLLSHSMGGAPLLYAASQPAFSADCVVIVSPFSSLRDMAVAGGLPRVLAFIMPDVWNNVRAVRAVRTPMMWVHSRSDTTIPIRFGREVYDAKQTAKTAVIVAGFEHNAVYQQTPEAIWRPIVTFVRRMPTAHLADR
jgi:uncharacterized protein